MSTGWSRSKWKAAPRLALLFLLGLSWSITQVQSEQAFLAPYGSYNQLFQYSDGTTSVKQTVQLRMADTLSSGKLQVGDYVLGVQSLPPVMTFRSRQIGTVPKRTSLHQEEVCLVQSTVARAVADDAISSQSYNTSTYSIAHSRRLLWHQAASLPSAVNDDSSSTQGQLYTSWCGLQQWTSVYQQWQQFLRVCTPSCPLFSSCTDAQYESMFERESPCKNTVTW